MGGKGWAARRAMWFIKGLGPAGQGGGETPTGPEYDGVVFWDQFSDEGIVQTDSSSEDFDDIANGEGFDGSGGAAHTSKAPCSRELRGCETKRETLGSDVDSQARSRPCSNRSEQFFV